MFLKKVLIYTTSYTLRCTNQELFATKIRKHKMEHDGIVVNYLLTIYIGVTDIKKTTFLFRIWRRFKRICVMSNCRQYLKPIKYETYIVEKR